MRTTDSLFKDESYFFAELKRIKGVLELLQNGERFFVILDEMLKGTNSVDKLSGSRELVKKLVQFNAVSLIATHDLKLSEMEKDHPGKIFNKCFEIRIENNEMVFDYILSDGVTKTMNATFLMKKMGII
jgi:DNA mismatch repair ATPase MutS